MQTAFQLIVVLLLLTIWHLVPVIQPFIHSALFKRMYRCHVQKQYSNCALLQNSFDHFKTIFIVMHVFLAVLWAGRVMEL